MQYLQSDVVGGFVAPLVGTLRGQRLRIGSNRVIEPRESIVDRLLLDTELFVEFGFESSSFALNGGWRPRGLSDAPRPWSLYE